MGLAMIAAPQLMHMLCWNATELPQHVIFSSNVWKGGVQLLLRCLVVSSVML